jgi:hypothetical protein
MSLFKLLYYLPFIIFLSMKNLLAYSSTDPVRASFIGCTFQSLQHPFSCDYPLRDNVWRRMYKDGYNHIFEIKFKTLELLAT